MRWQKTEFGYSGTRDGEAPAELLVVVLLGAGTAVETVQGAAVQWSRSLPSADFALIGPVAEAAEVVPALHAALDDAEVPPNRCLLVVLHGVAAAGVAAALRLRYPICAGLVAYGVLPVAIKDLPPTVAQIKIRLIGCRGDGCGDEEQFAQCVRDFGMFGADVRGSLMLEAGLSPAATRRGATYLAELAASTLAVARQQGGRLWSGRSPIVDKNSGPSFQ